MACLRWRRRRLLWRVMWWVMWPPFEPWRGGRSQAAPGIYHDCYGLLAATAYLNTAYVLLPMCYCLPATAYLDTACLLLPMCYCLFATAYLLLPMPCTISCSASMGSAPGRVWGSTSGDELRARKCDAAPHPEGRDAAPHPEGCDAAPYPEGCDAAPHPEGRHSLAGGMAADTH